MKINVTLSTKGIQDAIKQIRDYQNSLSDKAEMLAQRLAEIGAERAKVVVQELGAFDTGELYNSISFMELSKTKFGGIFVVRADSDHAAFVEFGTGQLGQEGAYPHPFPRDVDWQYNIGKTIFEFEPGQYGWYYPGKDGQWHFTQGMPSRPFMYEGWLDVYNNVTSVALEVFRS